jgi:uncharacterized Zn finger protein
MIDARGIPTCECPQCGSKYFVTIVTFDPIEYTIKDYRLDIQCNDCGTFTTAPTPENKPGINKN